MIRKFWKWFMGESTKCEHHWKVLKEFGTYEHTLDAFTRQKEKRRVGTQYHLQCDKCGDIKIK